MTQRLQGKLALVTAPVRGIGRAIAGRSRPKASRSSPPMCTLEQARRPEGARNALSSTCVRPQDRRGPRSRSAARNTARSMYSSMCGLRASRQRYSSAPRQDWDFSFDLNVKSMHRTIKAFLPGMLANGGWLDRQYVVGVSSIHGVPNRYAYGATKAAVIGLTKAVAADFIDQSIRATRFVPAPSSRPHSRAGIRDGLKDDRQIGRSSRASGTLSDANPWAGWVGPRKSRRSRIFLASDKSSYITGQAHLVDGGLAL